MIQQVWKWAFVIILIFLHVCLVYKLQHKVKIYNQIQNSAGVNDFDHQNIKISQDL